MKKLLKDSKKGGYLGHKARKRLSVVLCATGILFLIAIMCVLCGGAGIAAGAIIATIPAVGFTLPEGVEFTENEKKGINALANHFTKQFDEYAQGRLSEKDMLDKMNEKFQELGLSKEKLEALEKAAKEQGSVLAELKKSNNIQKDQLTGLKRLFNEKWDDLTKAIKAKQVNFEIKADELHLMDESLIHTTQNVTSTTTGAQLEESIGYDPNLYLKRRDKQYIHDIADVSYVAEVPETLVYHEEGDEQGYIAIVKENEVKPQVGLKLIKNRVNARKAAGWIAITDEFVKWRTRAWANIRRLFNDKVYRDYENILTDELIQNSTQYITTSLDGTYADPTDFHAMVAAIVQLENLNFNPNVIVLNPADKWKMSLATTSGGMFILPYIQSGGEFKPLGLRVIVTNKMPAGKFLIGEGGNWKIEEEAPILRTGQINDDAIHNRFILIGEIFFLSYVPSNNAGAFIMGDFADIKEALSLPETNPEG